MPEKNRMNVRCVRLRMKWLLVRVTEGEISLVTNASLVSLDPTLERVRPDGELTPADEMEVLAPDAREGRVSGNDM